MACPQSTEYHDAIQNLRSCVSDDELREGEPALSARGLPMLCSGNFADVYKVFCPRTGNTWAVKCFTREVPGLRDRYREISAWLEQAKLPFMVDFQFVEPGIRAGGQWYPFLKMRWVEGFELNRFVGDCLTRPQTLELLLQLWVKLARRLREAKIAHGDLQHGNVLLVPAAEGRHLSLRLIDYDGMCVPPFKGKRSGEKGHPAYQHPQRQGIYSPEVDRFSHLAIYCAIHGLRVGGPDLWRRFDNGDNLLFREADFRSPRTSELFRHLWAVSDRQTRALAGHLILATQAPPDRAVLLDDIISSGNVLPLGRRVEKRVAQVMDRTPKAVPAVPKKKPGETWKGLAERLRGIWQFIQALPVQRVGKTVAAVAFGVVGLIVLIAVISAGRGGGPKPEAKVASTSIPTATPANPSPEVSANAPGAAEPPASPPPKESSTESKTPETKSEASKTPQPADPPLGPIPQQAADWQEGHYLLARREANLGLAAAVTWLAEKHAPASDTQEAEKTAALLVRLLKPEEFQAALVMYRPLDAPTISAAVASLAKIGNKTARQALEQLIAGKLNVDNDRAATAAALEGLGASPRPEYEELLFNVLIAPGKARPPETRSSQQAGNAGALPGMYPGAPPALSPYGEMPGGPPSGMPPPGAAVPGMMPPGGMPPGMTPDTGMGPPGGLPYAAPYGLESASVRMTAVEVQRKALAVVEATASEAFRVRLAGHLVSETTAEPQRILLGRFLMEERAENVPAQILIYDSSVASQYAKTALEGYFAKFSSNATGLILGLPADQLPARRGQHSALPLGSLPGSAYAAPAGGLLQGSGGSSFGMGTLPVSDSPLGADLYPSAGMYGAMPGGYPDMPGPLAGTAGSAPTSFDKQHPASPDPDLPYRAARALWAPGFAGALQTRLEAIESLDKGAPLVLLASTMPLGAVRAQLFRTVRMHWDAGPRPLLAAGLFDQVVNEPGLVILVKSLPRGDPRREASPRVPAGRQRIGRGSMGAKARKAQEKFRAEQLAKQQREQQEQQLEQEWMQVSEQAVRALCRRLYAAGRARATGKNVDRSTAREQMPIELPAGAKPSVEYHLDWPADVQQKLEGVSLEPIKLHYMRIVDRGSPKRVADYFRGKMTRPDNHSSPARVWLESFLPNRDRTVSVDVMVTRLKDGAASEARMPGLPGVAAPGYAAEYSPGLAPGMPAGQGLPYGDLGLAPGMPGLDVSTTSETGNARLDQSTEVTGLIIEILAIEMRGFEMAD